MRVDGAGRGDGRERTGLLQLVPLGAAGDTDCMPNTAEKRLEQLGPDEIIRYSTTAMNHHAASGPHITGLKGREDYAIGAELQRGKGIKPAEARRMGYPAVFNYPGISRLAALRLELK